MIKSIILLLFLCPSVWSAADVHVFDVTEVEVPGTSMRIPKGFLNFYEAVALQIPEYDKQKKEGKSPHTPECIKRFFNPSYRNIFIKHGMPFLPPETMENEETLSAPQTLSTATLITLAEGTMTPIIDAIPKVAACSPEIEGCQKRYEQSIQSFIGEVTETFLRDLWMKERGQERGYTYPLDYDNPLVIEDLTNRLHYILLENLKLIQCRQRNLFTTVAPPTQDSTL